MKQSRGFSLIELMIVVAIIGILAAIAYPNYVDYAVRSNRSDAHVALSRAAALQERYYMDNNSYASDIAEVGGSTSPEGNYVISVTNPSCTTTVGGVNYYSCYLLTAKPKTGSSQATRDTGCATITLNDKGQKGSTGGGSCW